MTELEFRDFEIREVDQETREISGLAVPYNQQAQIGDFTESFERGVFGDPKDVTLFYGHSHRNGGMPIGKVTNFDDTEDGLHIRAKISKTTQGDEVYQLLKDGVLKRFSVGFLPVKNKTGEGTVVRQKATLHEVSVVPMPAYTGAVITEVRENTNRGDSQENTMTEAVETETRSTEIDEIRESVNGLERRIADIGDRPAAANLSALTEYRSLGAFIKDVVTSNNQERLEELRTYAGSTVANAAGDQPAWVNRAIQQVQDKRVFASQFNSAPLPAEGLTYSYPVFGTKTGDVAKQTNEGDTLANIQVTTTVATGTVSTYGGYTTVSRQVIDRADPSFLDTVFQTMAISYAKATNTAVRTAITGASGIQTGTVSAHTGAAWITALVTAMGNIAANSVNLSADLMLVSLATFETLAALVDSQSRPLFDINNSGVNTVGNGNLPALSGSFAGLRVLVDPTLTGTFAYVCSSGAATVREEAGAPFRLSDQNILTLTNDFSLYGYLGIDVNDPKGIVKLDASAG